MNKKEEKLSVMRNILADVSRKSGVSYDALNEISEESVVPEHVIIKAKEKIYEALEEVGLGALEIKEMTLAPRGDLYPEAEFSICCKCNSCKCKFC